MQIFVIKNQDGTQSVSKKTNDSDVVVGLWKLKSVKYNFMYSLVSEVKLNESLSINKTSKRKYHDVISPLSLTFAMNNILRKKRLDMVNKKNYLLVLNYIKSQENFFDNAVKIPTILDHFKDTENPIDRQLILDMVNVKLIYKIYHKIAITKKGYEYMKEK